MGAWSWSATSPSWCLLDIWVSFVYPTPNPKCLIFAVHISFVSSVLVATIKISFSVCHMNIWWFHWEGGKRRFCVVDLFIGLVYRKIYRKPSYLMVKTMVSCRFSLKPIQWSMSHLLCPAVDPRYEMSICPGTKGKLGLVILDVISHFWRPFTCPPCRLVNLYIDAEKPPFLHKCPKRTHWCSTYFCMLTLRYLGISYIIYPPSWNPDEYILFLRPCLIIYRWFSDIPSFLWSTDQLRFALS